MDDFTLEDESAPDHETVTEDELFAEDSSSSRLEAAALSSSVEEREQPSSLRVPQTEKPFRRARSIRAGDLLAGKYRVERVHAPGVLGTTVDAQHAQLAQRVAIKVASGDPHAFPARNARFLRASRLAAQFRNEHVARILDIGCFDSGTPYVVVEHFSGTDLRGVLRVREWLPPLEAVGYVLQACEGLAEAHVAGLAHRNLKPSNLFLAREDGRPKIKVLDFAIFDGAPGEGSLAMCATATMVDSLAYLAPEQIRDPALSDVRTDIWALGAVLHELLTGMPVYQAETPPGLFAAIVADHPTPASHLRPEISAELEAVVLRSLEKEPQARYSDLGTFVRQLRPFAGQQNQSTIDRIIMVLERRTRSSTRPVASAPAVRRAIVRVPPAPPAAPRRALELSLAALAVGGLSVGIGAFIAVHNLQGLLATRVVVDRPVVASLSPALPALALPAEVPVAGAAAPPAAGRSTTAPDRSRDVAPKAASGRAPVRAAAAREPSPYDEAPASNPVAVPATSAQALFENPN